MPHEDTEELTKQLRTRRAGLINLAAPYRRNWIDIRDFLAPRTARFMGEKSNDATRQDLNIINSSPRFAVRTLPAGMQSGVTSPMRPWFRLGTPDPDLEEFKPVKEWLFDVERVMRMVMSRSNLYDRLKSNYGILGTYGTSALFIEDDPDDIIRAFDFAMGSWYVANNDKGRVDTLYRDVNMTVVQWVTKFGLNKVPAYVKAQYDSGNYEAEFPIVHILEPNRLFVEGSALNKHKRWASIWLVFERSDKQAIMEWKGYEDQPFFCPRWDLVGEDVWGVGAGEYAIGDGKQLQLGEKRSLQILDKFANPTMVADASLRNQRKTNLPGDTTYVNGLITGNQGYRPAYQVTNPPFDLIEAKQRQIEERINEAFYKNLFLMVVELEGQPNITATQINMMREEKLMMLGPVLERLNDELLDPMIDNIFAKVVRRGMVPPPPPELEGMPLRVEYISVLAQAQKAMGIGNIERFIGFAGQMAELDPSALAKVNTFETINEYADGTGVPPKLVNTNDEAQETVAAQAQAAQAAQMLESGGQMADMAKTASETEVTGDSALAKAVENINAT